jgi:type I restriction enzyme R subunit
LQEGELKAEWSLIRRDRVKNPRIGDTSAHATGGLNDILATYRERRDQMGNFDFARATWPAIANEARRAEGYGVGDPRSSLFYSRRTLELIVEWLYRADSSLRRPYGNDLSSLLHEPTFKQLVGAGILTKMNLIRTQGNNAVHRTVALKPGDSVAIVKELFQVVVWVATHYSPDPADRPAPGVTFDVSLIPKPQPGAVAQSQMQIVKLAADLAKKDTALAAAEKQNDDLAAELAALRAEFEVIKARNATFPDTHDYREDETRDLFIDVLLREAGWPLDQPRDIEFPVTGMPNNSEGGKGFVDYVLWGEDGLPLGIVEAKRTKKEPNAGQQQAKLYADALERDYGQRPVIFYTNGYEHWIWDDETYPPREVQGFYTRDQLQLLIQRRTTRKESSSLPVNESIAGRHYQQRAVRKVGESFEHKERKALLVMATGSGKTRTVIALADLLIRANWAKRILFLADRVALVNQAVNAFKQQLPDSAPVNLITEKDTEGRVYVSTYPTMMGLIDQGEDNLRRFGPGYFDLIVIDEAHRSVYQKYGAIFDYFDSLLVGLTATPKDDIDHNTYGLFQLEDGVPTDSYELREAINEGYLVPPVGRSIATQFIRQGISYEDLSPDEKDQWDLLDWGEDEAPTEVDAAAVNNWLFNTDTVDKVLETLMVEGRKVDGGDRIGKTIIFARSNKHADFIQQRFDANYPEYLGHFARTITYKVNYVQSLIDDFSIAAKEPQIAISVDMLDTGIDIPEVVNLVFFKPVYSKTKYWQMVGRGTRLSPDLYAPGEDKKDFVIFDVCQNIEYFNENLQALEPAATASLGHRLFVGRLALMAGIDSATEDPELSDLREGLAARMHARVAGMNLDNFLVRTKRKAVERFGDGERWLDMSGDDYSAAASLADLPSATDVQDTDEQAKRFDLMVLRAQLGVIGSEGGFAAAKKRIQAIASGLGDQRNIPAITVHLELIDAVAGEDWWHDVTVPMLELVRIRLRGLVHLIDTTQQALVYTDFEDVLGSPEHVELTLIAGAVDKARFREKALVFLRSHKDDAVLFKLRHGKQLTPLDLEELERIMVETGGLSRSEIDAAATDAHGLGLFVRSMVGMDRVAASEALSAFTAGSTLTGNQLVFVDLIVDQLTQRGVVDPALLYAAPFTDIAPTGPDGLFTGAQVTSLVEILRRVQGSAEAS